MEEEIMTLQEVADYLKLSHVTVLRLARDGVIPAVKVGRQWRFSRERVRALIYDREVMRRMEMRR